MSFFAKKSRVGNEEVVVLDLNKAWPKSNNKFVGYIDDVDKLYENQTRGDDYKDFFD